MLFLILITGLCFDAALKAQYESKSTSDLKLEASQYFETGKYREALIRYQGLLKRYPKDGIFSYYCGLTLLNMNRNIPDAIDYLEFASSKTNVPVVVFYFLGEAYSRNYQFPEAKKSYELFAASSTKKEQKELIPSHLAEMSSNAIDLTSSYNQVEILSTSLFTFSDSLYTMRVVGSGGQLLSKPSEILSVSEKPGDLTSLMFIPWNREKGDILFYSGYEKNKKEGADIFMIKALNGHRFGEPVAVEAVNTEYDEVLPYYDPVGNDLFFASKGHNSMGGFDLFKSHYDTERNNWSSPINLGFPVNSPFNEFLLIPGTDLGSMILITDRQGLDSMITIYKLQIREPRIQLTETDPAGLKKTGNLGGIEAIPSMPDMSIDDIFANKAISTEEHAGLTESSNTGSHNPDQSNSPDYQKLLEMALDQQFKSDSLAKLSLEARIKVKDIPGADERWVIQKDIIAWEKKSTETQEKADEYYTMLKQLEIGTRDTKNIPDAIEIDTVINDITVYKFKSAETNTMDSVVSQRTGTSTVHTDKDSADSEPGKLPEPVKKTDKELNRFMMSDRSPYSPSNPFPENTDFPKGPCYKIQVAVLSRNADWNAFGGFTPVYSEPVRGKPMTKYYIGNFTQFDRAKEALETVRKGGFPAAFIVAWYDGQKTTLNKVVELEKK